jgi:MFS family permease
MTSTPARFEGRRRAIPLAASTLLVGGAVNLLSLLVQLYLKSRGAPILLISMVSTINAAGALAGGLMWGSISDHVRRRRLLSLLVVALSAGIGVLVFLPPASIVLGTSLANSLFFSGNLAVTTAIISGASAAARRGKNLSYVSSARAVGFALGAVASGYLLERLGFRFSFAVAAVLPLVALVFVLRLPAENAIRRPRSSNALRHALSSGLGGLYAALALRQMAIVGAFALLYVYMDSLGISPGIMGVVSSLNMVTQVGALVLFGWLADRIGRRRIFMLGFALSILTPCHFVILPNVPGMVLGYVTLGLAYSSLHVGATAHIGDRVPEERQGQMLGLYESSRGLGGLAGPALAGTLIPVIGYRGMFLTMAGIAGLSLLLMVLGEAVRRRRARDGARERSKLGSGGSGD